MIYAPLSQYCHQDLRTFPNVLRLKSKLRILFHFKNVWTGNAAQSDEYIYFDDYGEIAETGYPADLGGSFLIILVNIVILMILANLVKLVNLEKM